MSINPTWQLALSLVLLVALTVAFSAWGRLGIGKASVWAAARAIIQLGVVSMVLVYALKHLWAAALFTLLMFAVAVRTTAKRTEIGRAWPWAAAWRPLLGTCSCTPTRCATAWAGSASRSAGTRRTPVTASCCTWQSSWADSLSAERPDAPRPNTHSRPLLHDRTRPSPSDRSGRGAMTAPRPQAGTSRPKAAP